jgi:hypothetical protein
MLEGPIGQTGAESSPNECLFLARLGSVRASRRLPLSGVTPDSLCSLRAFPNLTRSRRPEPTIARFLRAMRLHSEIRIAQFIEYALMYSVDLQPERCDDWRPESNVVGKHPPEFFGA